MKDHNPWNSCSDFGRSVKIGLLPTYQGCQSKLISTNLDASVNNKYLISNQSADHWLMYHWLKLILVNQSKLACSLLTKANPSLFLQISNLGFSWWTTTSTWQSPPLYHHQCCRWNGDGKFNDAKWGSQWGKMNATSAYRVNLVLMASSHTLMHIGQGLFLQWALCIMYINTYFCQYNRI